MNNIDITTHGLKGLDGIDYIVKSFSPHDMGDSGRKIARLKEKFMDGRYGRFVWASKRTGNIVYKEITKDEYYTQEENLNKF